MDNNNNETVNNNETDNNETEEMRPENDIEANINVVDDDEIRTVSTNTLMRNLSLRCYEECAQYVYFNFFLLQTFAFPIIMSYFIMDKYKEIQCIYGDDDTEDYTELLQFVLLLNNYLLIIWYGCLLAYCNRRSYYSLNNSYSRRFMNYVKITRKSIFIVELLVICSLVYLLFSTNCKETEPYNSSYLYYANMVFGLLVFLNHAEFGRDQ